MAKTAPSRDKINEALSLLNEAAAEKRDELKELVTDKYSHLRETLAAIQNEVGEAAAQGVRRLTEVKDAGAAKVKDMAASVDDHVRSNPWCAVGFTALGTFIVGFLLGRKK